MKCCGYCGKENDEAAPHCFECGTSFDVPAVAPDHITVKLPEPRLIDLQNIEGAFLGEADDFSRPDWAIVTNAIVSKISPEQQNDAWNEVVFQWIERLRKELGGRYRIDFSPKFVLLSGLRAADACEVLTFAENSLVEICSRLGGLAWGDTPARHVILLFEEEDDYYTYVGAYESGEVIPGSVGTHFSAGYPHLAIKHESDIANAQTLVHELTHHCLTHLPIPLWLNEGVAQRLQRAIAGMYAPRSHDSDSSDLWAAMTNWVPPLMWDELADKHFTFWNERNIQEFWAGTSFKQPGDGRELSYSLAEVLVHFLGQDRNAFLTFLSQASYVDAGQTAALDCLGLNLGDAVGTFLGEGSWRPLRKAMVECWQAEATLSTNDTEPENK